MDGYTYKLGTGGGDTLTAATSDNYVVDGGNGIDTLYGNIGNDILWGGSGGDTLYGGAGSDVLHGNAGDDTLNGGDGSDTASYITAAAGVTVDLTAGEATNDGDGGEDTFTSIENVRGSNYNDTLGGTSGANIFFGSEGSDLIDGAGGYDSLSYADLRDKVSVTVYDDSLSVSKGVSSALGTDTVSEYIPIVIGTEHNDAFLVALGDIPAYTPHLQGGAGADLYTFDLADGSYGMGVVDITDDSAQGLDTISFLNFDDNTMRLKFELDGSDRLLIVAEKENSPGNWVAFLTIRMDKGDILSGMGVDSVSFDGGTYRLLNVAGYADSQSGDLFYSDDINDIYDYSSGGWNGGSGAAGGTMPTFNGSGDITSMTYSPFYNHNWVPRAYGVEIMHPSVITSLSVGPGAMTMTTQTYLKEVAFHPGISMHDVRFTTSGTAGNMSLVINIDDLGQSFTIPYFETGRTINGIAVYNTTLHEYVQEASGATLVAQGGGQYNSNYTGGTPPSISGTITVNYILERISFYDGYFDMTGDIIFEGTSGNDNLSGMNDGNDTLYGYGGNDNLSGNSGNDTLYGGDGADQIYGNNGNDHIYGGAGADTLIGGAGDDTYYFSPGWSGGSGAYDQVSENASSGTDTLRFTGISISDLRMWSSGGYAYFGIVGDSTSLLRLSDSGSASYASTLPLQIEQIVFDGGTTWNLSTGFANMTDTDDAHSMFGSAYADTMDGRGGNDTLYGHDGDDTLYGGDGNDAIHGNNGNDHIYGGAGADNLYGGTGDDTFYFSAGWSGGGGAYDQVSENTSSGTDTLRFIGISASDLRMWSLGGYTYFGIAGDSTSLLRISDSGSASYASVLPQQIEQIAFDAGTTWNLSAGLANMTDTDDAHNMFGSAYADTMDGRGGNDTLYGHDGNDTLYGGDGADQIYGNNGHDHIYGGAGADTLMGGVGDDTYYFSAGWSGGGGVYDQVSENTSSGTDTLRFTGISSSDLRMWSSGGYTYFGIVGDSTSLLRMSDSGSASYASVLPLQIEQIVFDDGTTWNLSAGLANMTDTDDAHSMYGSAYADIMDGRGGNDTLYGHDGNDTLYGGDGNDTVHGNNDNDTLYGGNGNDLVYGGNGNDYLDGGSGSDTLNGDAGDDTYVYTAGLDTISESGGTDVLRMGSGIDVNTISFSNVSTYNTKIVILSGVDELTINYLRYSTSYHVERIVFADGFETSLPDYASWVNGTGSADLIAYSSADDTILGKGGNDTITAGAGNDDVHGGDGDDLISGEDGNDLLHGGAGNDILYGGDGLDTLFGGAGDDTFVFENTSAFNNVDVIKDFNVSDDIIDISDLLGSYNSLTDLIADFVEMTTSGSDTIIKIDRDGTGGTYSLTQIATIQGVTGLTDEAALVTNGNLIVT